MSPIRFALAMSLLACSAASVDPVGSAVSTDQADAGELDADAALVCTADASWLIRVGCGFEECRHGVRYAGGAYPCDQ